MSNSSDSGFMGFVKNAGETIGGFFTGKGSGPHLDDFIPNSMLSGADTVAANAPGGQVGLDVAAGASLGAITGFGPGADAVFGGLLGGLGKVFGFTNNSTMHVIEEGLVAAGGIKMLMAGLSKLNNLGGHGFLGTAAEWTIGLAVGIGLLTELPKILPKISHSLGLDH